MHNLLIAAALVIGQADDPSVADRVLSRTIINRLDRLIATTEATKAAPAKAESVLTALPQDPRNGVGVVRAPTPGKWVVMSLADGGLSVVIPWFLDGDQEKGYRTVAFEGPAGSYAVIFFADGPEQPQVQNVVIHGGSPNPDPDPGPGPGPGPDPDPDPDPEPTDFQGRVKAWLKNIPAEVYSKERALAVASNYESVASEASATSGWDRDQMVSATKSRNIQSLGAPIVEAWVDPFFLPLALEHASRGLSRSDVPGHVALWQDTAAAIRAGAP